jgi:hypothetical protein
MRSPAIQQALFNKVKDHIPSHLSLVDELAELLGISADSAYRRIRGEKELSITEIERITQKFKISFDSLSGGSNGVFVFHGRLVDHEQFKFDDWLASLHQQLAMVAQGPEPTFIFQSKDVPLFHHFQWAELSTFKFFFWRRTILQQESPDLKVLDLARGDPAMLAMARKVFLAYCHLPSIEIWNAESINSTLRQIQYYRETGIFVREQDAQLLFDQCLALLDHLESQAEHGLKFPCGTPPGQGSASYELYLNEVLLGDNAIYASNGRQRMVFLNHTGVNYIGTTDPAFLDYTHRSLRNIIKRSTMISGSGEKERRRFFRELRSGVERKRQ